MHMMNPAKDNHKWRIKNRKRSGGTTALNILELQNFKSSANCPTNSWPCPPHSGQAYAFRSPTRSVHYRKDVLCLGSCSSFHHLSLAARLQWITRSSSSLAKSNSCKVYVDVPTFATSTQQDKALLTTVN